jgi:ribonuclease P protein component
MLQQLHRLPAHSRLFHPTTYRTPLFLLKISKNNLPVSRFGFVVRKSIDKRATARNRIRRVFRSCIEEGVNRIAVGYDMLFFLEKGIIDKQQDSLGGEIKAFLAQKKLIQ